MQRLISWRLASYTDGIMGKLVEEFLVFEHRIDYVIREALHIGVELVDELSSHRCLLVPFHISFCDQFSPRSSRSAAAGCLEAG
jgi:hypothetical protein